MEDFNVFDVHDTQGHEDKNKLYISQTLLNLNI